MCSAEVMKRSDPALKSMPAALALPSQFSAVIARQFQVRDLRHAHLVDMPGITETGD